MDDLHPADTGGGSVPYSEIGLKHSSGVAPETGAGAGTHICVFFGVRLMEGLGAMAVASGPRELTSDDVGRAGTDSKWRRGIAHHQRRDPALALHRPDGEAPADDPPTAGN